MMKVNKIVQVTVVKSSRIAYIMTHDLRSRVAGAVGGWRRDTRTTPMALLLQGWG